MKDYILVEREDGSNLRIKQKVDAQRKSGLYPIRIEIMWDRSKKIEDEMDMVDKFEQNLIGVAESKLEAICTTIYQDDKWFIFTMYVNNTEKFGALLNHIMMFFPPLPLKIMSTDDANWEDYDKTLKMINI